MLPRLLSVVIVNYNTHDDLHACLTAIQACQPMPEVIVVDNASTDNSAAMVKNEFPNTILIEPGRNIWFCGGNNLGIAAAHGAYVLLLNPDTIPAPDAFARMVEFLHHHPEYAGVTGQLRYPHGAVQQTCSRLPTFRYLLLTQTMLQWLMPAAARRASVEHTYSDHWARDVDQDVGVIPGSCLMMRREALHLNPVLYLYFPEEDIARRAHGRLFRFVAAAKIIHREKSSTKTRLATRLYFRDMLTYTRQYHGVFGASLLWLLSRPVVWGMALKSRLSQPPRK